LPCFAAFLALVRFSGLFAFTQLFFQTQQYGEPKSTVFIFFCDFSVQLLSVS